MNTVQNNREKANVRMLLACGVIVLGMLAMSYAAVPLYRIFCQVTGYGGTTQRAELLDGVPVLDREITVRFDANASRKLDWEFEPIEREVKVRLGEQKQVSYFARNLSDKPVTGMATFNVTPQHAGVYFNKIECFCFTETTLEAGEKIDMPVVFFIDPDMDEEKIMENLETITLSYTFFPEESSSTPSASVEDKMTGSPEL